MTHTDSCFLALVLAHRTAMLAAHKRTDRFRLPWRLASQSTCNRLDLPCRGSALSVEAWMVQEEPAGEVPSDEEMLDETLSIVLRESGIYDMAV